jgi:hypothetical protein
VIATARLVHVGRESKLAGRMEDAGLIAELHHAEMQRQQQQQQRGSPLHDAAAQVVVAALGNSQMNASTTTLPPPHQRRDPIPHISCVMELWMGSSAYTLSQASSVSHAWSASIRLLRSQINPTVNISVDDALHANAPQTTDRVVHRVLTSSPHTLAELHLHGLERISDHALCSLVERRRLRLVSLTYCTRLTTGIRRYLPPSVRELRVAGCISMYRALAELATLYTLDVHVCPRGLQLVEEQALAGFRFVDPSMRAGIRCGPLHSCSACTSSRTEASSGHEPSTPVTLCAVVPDFYGATQPELWHASSFDWGFFADEGG